MMTKATFFKFLLQNQVPLRLAQRAVEIIDGKARAHMPLSGSETDLIGVGERHVGRYYITPVRHHAPKGGHRGVRDGLNGVRRGDGEGLESLGATPGTEDHWPAAHGHGTQSNITDMAFVQERAQRVVDEDEHPLRRWRQ